MNALQKIIDNTTTYRVVIYGLMAIVAWSLVVSALGLLGIHPFAIAASVLVVLGSALATHWVCARVFKAPANSESSIISALIVGLIITPTLDPGLLVLAALFGVAVVALKYVVRHSLRHLFNPAALVLFLAGLTGYVGVEWWVGSRYIVPIVAITGLIVALKIRRLELIGVYIVVSVVALAATAASVEGYLGAVAFHFVSWPTLFFAAFMLTEPLGLPSTASRQYIYAAIAGLVGAVPYSFGIIHGTPELSLLIANLFTYVVDRPERLRLTFLRKQEVGAQVWEYFFAAPKPQHFVAGQYLEWTLPHSDVDDRGVRRYLTIASAPNGSEISFAVRHGTRQSSWKAALERMTPGSVLYATQKAGDFTLSHAPRRYVWIAGGIGVTPFMSMLRAGVIEASQSHVTLLYCNRTEADIAFLDELNNLQGERVHIVHVLDVAPTTDLTVELGRITPSILKRHAPEWQSAVYYISGPPGLVRSYAAMLRGMGISSRSIITDFFPGLA